VPKIIGQPEGTAMREGISIMIENSETRLKWHRLRRSMNDPVFGTAVMTAGFAQGASMELDLRVCGAGGDWTGLAMWPTSRRPAIRRAA
jgi:hypothetical protein